MNKYSFRVFGTFSAENYAGSQLALLSALSGLPNVKVQSIELSEWEAQPAADIVGSDGANEVSDTNNESGKTSDSASGQE